MAGKKRVVKTKKAAGGVQQYLSPKAKSAVAATANRRYGADAFIKTVAGENHLHSRKVDTGLAKAAGTQEAVQFMSGVRAKQLPKKQTRKPGAKRK